VNIHELNKSPGSVADWSDTAALQQRMVESVQEMERMAPEVGLSRHVTCYDSDRRKQALARAMMPALKGGESGVKAEAEARASKTYEAELSQLSVENKMAEQTIQEFEVLKIKWSTAQSLLSFQKEAVKRL